MRLIEIIKARKELEDLAELKDVDIYLCYKMTKFIKETQAEFTVYLKRVQGLIEEYRDKSRQDAVAILPDKINEFQQKMAELDNTEMSPPNIYFTLPELSQSLKLTMKQMYPLLPFIKEDIKGQ